MCILFIFSCFSFALGFINNGTEKDSINPCREIEVAFRNITKPGESVSFFKINIVYFSQPVIAFHKHLECHMNPIP